MKKSLIEIKNELIEWIELTYDLEVLQKIAELKYDVEQPAIIFDIDKEAITEINFDQQFAAGMNSDELLDNIAAHLESLDTKKPISDC